MLDRDVGECTELDSAGDTTTTANRAAGTDQRHRLWNWVLAIVSLSVLTLALVFIIMMDRAAPILRGRIIETLAARFESRVELDSVNVSILKGLSVSGHGLRIYPPDEVIAAGAADPLIAIDSFNFHAPLRGLFFKPMHVSAVNVTGVTIHIPAKEYRAQGHPKRHRGKIKILVDEIMCDNSRLVIGTTKPNAEPKTFDLQHIVMRDFGASKPWPYDATLTNAIPRGNIHATGTFGPWNREIPGNSAVTGDYSFDHVELNTIHGIGGILTSTGSFSGQLNRIVVDGSTDTPSFEIDTAKHPMPLHTDFHAIVDGTTGDTYLQPVHARLGTSSFVCSGKVVNQHGKGKTIDLDIDIPNGRVRDFLTLSVKTSPPVLSGALNMRARLVIPPGPDSVSRKANIRGQFVLTQIHFSNPAVQDKVDILSLRAQGRPHEAQPGAADVRSSMRGAFALSGGLLTFRDLDYTLPGARVHLAGEYTLDGQRFNFAGKVRTDAKLSQMIASWWKSILLKPVDPFFHKHGAGAEIPVKITGTQSAPKFGLDLGSKKKN
ncbi:MAG: hypothetical protein JWM54_1906 [Acidobacteriaceae bacterium]|nr:hypothetical protein [Acidobacteriaceae bacterium]